METLIVSEKVGEDHYWARFYRNLARCFSVYAVGPGKVLHGGSGRELLLVGENRPLLLSGPSVWIPAPGADLSRLSEEGRPSVSVVLSSCAETVRTLSERQMQTLTCGMSSKDTLTFSSVYEGKAVVSLQRSLVCPDGRQIEPMEWIFAFPPGQNPEILLLYTAALLLCRGSLPDPPEVSTFL